MKITGLFSATCEDEWQEYNIGGQNYCFKAIGAYKPINADVHCDSLYATLPLPNSNAENEDLRVAMADLGQDNTLIGISDSTSHGSWYRMFDRTPIGTTSADGSGNTVWTSKGKEVI